MRLYYHPKLLGFGLSSPALSRLESEYSACVGAAWIRSAFLVVVGSSTILLCASAFGVISCECKLILTMSLVAPGVSLPTLSRLGVQSSANVYVV